MNIVMGEGITRTSDPDAIMYDFLLNFKEMMPLKISLLETSKKQAIKFVKNRCPTAISISPLRAPRKKSLFPALAVHKKMPFGKC